MNTMIFLSYLAMLFLIISGVISYFELRKKIIENSDKVNNINEAMRFKIYPKLNGIEEYFNIKFIEKTINYNGKGDRHYVLMYKKNDTKENYTPQGLITPKHIKNLLPCLTKEASEDLFNYCKKQSITHKDCFGDGTIILKRYIDHKYE